MCRRSVAYLGPGLRRAGLSYQAELRLATALLLLGLEVSIAVRNYSTMTVANYVRKKKRSESGLVAVQLFAFNSQIIPQEYCIIKPSIRSKAEIVFKKARKKHIQCGFIRVQSAKGSGK